MRHYNLKLEQYGIGEYRYRELEFFCLQYPEKRQHVMDLLHGSFPVSETPGRAGVSKPTEGTAMRLMLDACLEDCEQIEQSALEAVRHEGEGVMYQWLIKYVTLKRKPLINEIPCGRRQFYEMRRRFFVSLHNRRVTTGQ